MIDKAKEILSIPNLIFGNNQQLDTLFFPIEDEFWKCIVRKVLYLNSTPCMTKVILEVILKSSLVKVLSFYIKGYQLKAYRKTNIDNLDDNVYKNSINCSLMNLSNKMYGVEAFTSSQRVYNG